MSRAKLSEEPTRRRLVFAFVFNEGQTRRSKIEQLMQR
jgi:hypothetical protein